MKIKSKQKTKKMIVKCKCQNEQERVFLFRVQYINKQEVTK